MAKYKKNATAAFPHGTVRIVFSTFFAITLVASFLLPPLSAKASIFSSFSNNSSTSADLQTPPPPQNSQKLALLQATVNPDPLAKKTPIDTSIVDGEALSNENRGFTKTFSTSTDLTNLPGPDQISVYTVHSGDTFAQIAQMFGVSVNTILFANDLTRGSSITAGQVLVILPISGVQYTVKKGDTVSSIAKAFAADASEIADYNNFTVGSALTIGDQIIIPNVEGPSIATTVKTSTSGKTTSGKFVSPVGGSLVDPNGYFIRPISGGVRTQGIHGHNAVDLATAYGSPIFAAAEGTVIVVKASGYNGGYGSYVVIQHPNGMQTLYAHMSKVNTVVGATVSQGQTIGFIGTTGHATGPHVHFEVHGGVNPF